MRSAGAALAVLALITGGVACAGGVEVAGDAPAACTVVDLVVEPDALEVHRDLAEGFNGSDDHELADGGCATVRVRSMTPDRVADGLLDGWDEGGDGPAPALWSPGWSAWVDRVDAARAEDDREAVTGARVALMASPLVLALPAAVAEAMGHPDRAIGWSDLVRLADDPQGWAAYGHPEWGQLRVGKTDPRVASDGLAALVGQAHAARAGGGEVTPDVLTDPTVEDHVSRLERSVIHYGWSAEPFLDRWSRAEDELVLADLAVPVVEERRVLLHDVAAPTAPGETDVELDGRPALDLVPVAPAEGTPVLDHPVVEVTTRWVTERQETAREAYLDHLTTDAAGAVARDAGFRRPDLSFAPGSPATSGTEVAPERPVATVATPEAVTIGSLLDAWPGLRRGSRVLVLVDASASMGQPAVAGGPTRLTMVRDALVRALSDLDDEADIGVWAFGGDLRAREGGTHVELVETGPLAEVRDDVEEALAELSTGSRTPLLHALGRAVDEAATGYDPNRINSVVVVSDGVNADGDASDDAKGLDELTASLAEQSTGASGDPIRVFPIAFGDTADVTALRRIARASNGVVFDARDPDDLPVALAAAVRTV